MSFTQTERRIQTVCLMILCAIAGALSLHWLKPVIVPFVWAVFLWIILSPLIDFQIRYLRAPRPIALVFTLLLVFAVVAILGGLIASSVSEFAANSKTYEATVEQLLEKAESTGLLNRLGLPQREELDLTSLIPSGTVKGVFVKLTNAMMGLLSRGLLVMLFVIFLTVGSEMREEPREGFIGEMGAGVKRYVFTKVVVSGATGLAVFVILRALGVPYAVTFGAFAFILNFIPSVGSIIATILPLPVLLLSPDISTTTLILAIVIPGTVQIAVGNAVEPRMMGKSLDLHPITILLALIFWGMIWGFEGMILAVPITAVLKIILEKLEMTASIANVMAGRLDAGPVQPA